jgi:hypothetical protein
MLSMLAYGQPELMNPMNMAIKSVMMALEPLKQQMQERYVD